MSGNQVTFGLFTDPHYAKRPSRNRRQYAESLRRVEQCLELFRREQTDFIVCLGDLTDHPDHPEAGRNELAEVADRIGASGLEFHLALGNHDIDTLSRETLYQVCGTRPEPYYSFDRGGVHFVVLDSNYDQKGTPYLPGENVWDDTYLGAAQIEWLQEDLAGHSSQAVIVLVHANLDPFMDGENPESSESLNPHVIKDACLARAVLEAHPSPVTVFQGHYHPGREQMENGISYHTLPAIVELQEGYYCLTVHVTPEGTVCQEWRG